MYFAEYSLLYPKSPKNQLKIQLRCLDSVIAKTMMMYYIL
jgi:hypothetical protein